MSWQFSRDAQRQWRWSCVGADGAVEKEGGTPFDHFMACFNDARKHGCPSAELGMSTVPPRKSSGFIGSARGERWLG